MQSRKSSTLNNIRYKDGVNTMNRTIALLGLAVSLLAGCQSFRIPAGDDYRYQNGDAPDPRAPSKPKVTEEIEVPTEEKVPTAEEAYQADAEAQAAAEANEAEQQVEEPVKRTKPKKLSPMTPAVESLLKKANIERSHQNYERAEYYVERALSINPDSPHTHFFYSQLLLEEQKNALAESRAFKALSLCEDDSYLKRRLWQLIAISRQRQGNIAGSRDARRRAEQYAH